MKLYWFFIRPTLFLYNTIDFIRNTTIYFRNTILYFLLGNHIFPHSHLSNQCFVKNPHIFHIQYFKIHDFQWNIIYSYIQYSNITIFIWTNHTFENPWYQHINNSNKNIIFWYPSYQQDMICILQRYKLRGTHL